VEGRLAVGVAQAGLEDAEEIVDPVVERVWVALDVEEEIAGRSSGREQARSGSGYHLCRLGSTIS
jgi:hypothetical protein